MSIPRLFVCCLLVAVSAMPLAAQSLGRDSAVPEFQLNTPSDSSDRILVDRFRLPSDSALPADSYNAAAPVQTAMGPVHRLLSDAVQVKDWVATCYSMRSYKVVRANPQSDATKPAGYSTCQSAKHFQMKIVEDSPELIKR